MIYRSRRPAPPLDRAIASLWYFQSAPRPFALERILPSGAAQLVVNLAEDRTRIYDPGDGRCRTSPGAVLTGARTTFEVIDTDEQTHVVGVRFHPGGTGALFRPPAHELGGPDVPLECLWNPAAAARLRERLLAADGPDAALDVLDATLRAQWQPVEGHRAVTAALQVFHRRPHAVRVGSVAEAVGLSPKRFIERFRTEVGLTPKQYCRVRRFQQALTAAHAAPEVDWAAVAVSAGYYDQAHFIHDFRRFSGLTPTGYRAGRTAFQNHVTFLQSPGS